MRRLPLLLTTIALLLCSTAAFADVLGDNEDGHRGAGRRAGSEALVERWGAYSGDSHRMATPTPISGFADPIAVRASNDSNYVLEANGAVEAFGTNARGELGDATEEGSLTIPVRMDYPEGVVITSIGQGEDAYYDVDSTGQLWGGGDAACIKRTPLVPTKYAGLTTAVEAEGGGHHVLILLTNGTLDVCGNGEYGQLGLGQGTMGVSTPTPVPGLSNVVEVQAGEDTSCARTESGEMYEWGEDEDGQIGNGTTQEGVFTPYHVPLPGPASAVYCGGDLVTNGTSFAVVGGEVYGWGKDGGGQVGDSARFDKVSPTRTGIHASFVATGNVCAVGLSSTGEAIGWGANEYACLGVPGRTT